MRQLLRIPLLLLLLAQVGCAAGRGGESRPRTRTDLILAEELTRASYTSVYDAVAALRPRWLQTRGKDTIHGEVNQVQVYFDGVRLSGVGALREIPTMGIRYLQHFDPISASARWGLNHHHGAIYVSTQEP